jgi:hypothetical protein
MHIMSQHVRSEQRSTCYSVLRGCLTYFLGFTIIVILVILGTINNTLHPPVITITNEGFPAPITYSLSDIFSGVAIHSSGYYAFKNAATTPVMICIEDEENGGCDDSHHCPALAPSQLCRGLVLRSGEEQRIWFDASNTVPQDYWLMVSARDGSISFNNNTFEVSIVLSGHAGCC